MRLEKTAQKIYDAIQACRDRGLAHARLARRKTGKGHGVVPLQQTFISALAWQSFPASGRRARVVVSFRWRILSVAPLHLHTIEARAPDFKPLPTASSMARGVWAAEGGARVAGTRARPRDSPVSMRASGRASAASCGRDLSQLRICG